MKALQTISLDMIADNLILAYTECESLDDLLEIMYDNGLLSFKGQVVKTEIWKKTEHNVRDKIEDPLERSWLGLTAHHKNFLIAEAKKGVLNTRANSFVLSKTDEMKECYELSLGK